MKSKFPLFFTFILAVVALSSLAFAVNSQQDAHGAQTEKPYAILNPYEHVDWDAFGKYKAALHAHSTHSGDGENTLTEMVEDHYAKGFDILAMTDHNIRIPSWDQAARDPVSPERKAEIGAGLGRDGRGMIGIDHASEHSVSEHINSYWLPYDMTFGDMLTMEATLATVEEMGGISLISHSGRYVSNHISQFKNYACMFMDYPSFIGMEIINGLDGESREDRVLWDGILVETMPQGRPVWGFSNDDAHRLDAVGYAWNVMLMPSLGQAQTRKAMEAGRSTPSAVSLVTMASTKAFRMEAGCEVPAGPIPCIC